MIPLARGLITLGLVLIVIGGVIYIISRLGLPLGQLPGDIRIQGKKLTCVIPLLTSILLSIVLTVLLNPVVRLMNK